MTAISNTKYYGEKYIADEIALAPNAVVILSHLCYASGNSEPGRSEPSLAVARQRMDNFAAGFLDAGARAVIAEGHSDPSWYMEQLFTTRRTIEDMWRSGPHPQGNVFSFASVRSPGYTVFADPDRQSGSAYTGFYRSLVTKSTLTTVHVTGAGYARTDIDPSGFSAPGAAEVIAPQGAGLFADATLTPDPTTGLAPATLPAGTRLRLLAAAGPAPDGGTVFQVAGLDGSPTGFTTTTGLRPRDGTPPQVWEVDAGTGALSPNDDGSGDTVTLALRASEWVSWRVDIADSGATVVRTMTADGELAQVDWSGMLDGVAVPDGAYMATLTARDGWGNAPATATVRLVVDTVPPALEKVQAQALPSVVFTPNGDGDRDSVAVGFGATETGTVAATVRGPGDIPVATFDTAMAPGPGTATWDGRTDGGSFVADGAYEISLRPTDRAGNRGAEVATTVVAFRALGFVASSEKAIYTRDADRLAKHTALSFRLVSPTTVSWTLRNGSGTPVITRLDASPLAAGTHSWTWKGRLPSGAWAPAGDYLSTVVATDGETTVTQTARIRVTAFRLTLSDETPQRGQLVTAKVVSTESLGASPRLKVLQPGLARAVYTTSRLSKHVYRVTFRLSSRGSAGPLVLKVVGRDIDGGRNKSRFVRTIE